MTRGRWAFPICTALTAALVALPAGAASGQSSEPPPPPGANDACTQSQDPTPVVLVHGTFANRVQMGSTLSPQLEAEGYCVFALNYGNCSPGGSCGRARIQSSAQELKRFIANRVLPHSRSGDVAIVGHSQGGLMSRYYIRFLGGESKVDDMISLSASNHGTDNPFSPPAGEAFDCPACEQQHPYRSDFTERVNRGDETPGTIDYTQIQTRLDEIVVPYFSAFLADEAGTPNSPRTKRQNGRHTTNFCLQDGFPGNTSDHLAIVNDQQAFDVVLNALERDGRPARPPAQPDTVCAQTNQPTHRRGADERSENEDRGSKDVSDGEDPGSDGDNDPGELPPEAPVTAPAGP